MADASFASNAATYPAPKSVPLSVTVWGVNSFVFLLILGQRGITLRDSYSQNFHCTVNPCQD
jgi:hypothetical protein